jgi:hypothetical protein
MEYYFDKEKRVVLKSDVSSINAAMDQIANITAPSKIAAVNMGNDSTMEKAKSGKLAAIDEKSENANDANGKKPDWESPAIRSLHAKTIPETEQMKTDDEIAIFIPKIRRSRWIIRDKILSVRSAGGFS